MDNDYITRVDAKEGTGYDRNLDERLFTYFLVLVGVALFGSIIYYCAVIAPNARAEKALQDTRNARANAARDATSLRPITSVRRDAALDALATRPALSQPSPGLYQYRHSYAALGDGSETRSIAYDLLLKADGSFAIEKLEGVGDQTDNEPIEFGTYRFTGQTLTLSRPESGYNRVVSYGLTRFAVVAATGQSFSIAVTDAAPLRFILQPTTNEPSPTK